MRDPLLTAGRPRQRSAGGWLGFFFLLGFLGGRERRRHAQHVAQHAADPAKVQRRVEVLGQAEHVALGVAARVPPALAVVVDDDDLAGAATVLQVVAAASPLIQLVAATHPLQQGGAVHPRLQLLDLRIVLAHCSALPSRDALVGPVGAFPLPFSPPRLPRRSAGRARRKGAKRAARPVPCVARSAGGIAISVFLRLVLPPVVRAGLANASIDFRRGAHFF